MSRVIRARSVAPALFFGFLLISGCGGGGSSSSSSSSSPLTFTLGGFNGNSTRAEGTPTAVVENSRLVVNASSGPGGLTISLPASPIVRLGTFPISAGKASAEYFDSTQLVWGATSGAITIVRASRTSVSVRLDGVSFEPDSGVLHNFASGGFALSGNLPAAPLASGSSSKTSLVFSEASNVNGDTSPVTAGALVFYDYEAYLPTAQTVVVPPLQPNRLFTLTTNFEPQEGQVIDFSQGSLTHAGLIYSEANVEEGDRNWDAMSGTATIVRKVGNAVEIRLDAIRFVAPGGIGSSATGSFRVDGTITKG